jgi:aryl-alcohol dehydrogenase-like predicted oxidoreductase
MRYRELGNSGQNLSEIGLGTWAIGGGDWGMGWGDQRKEDSIDAILEALECGINWIDTAHAYGFGVAETVVAEALSEWKEDVFVATKCGVLPKQDGSPERFISPKSILEEVEGSLRRLKVEAIDLYQIHWPHPIENLADSWQTLIRLKEEGKVIDVGVCNCYLDELKLLGIPEHITSNQPMYNMLERKIESEVLPWCKENRVSILAYSPMHSGLLTGKVSQEWFDGLPMNDWRKHKVDHPVVSPLQSEKGLSRFMTFQSELESIAREGGRTIGELATAWVLRKQEVTSAIVGARKKGQISEICQVTERPLSKDEETLVGQALSSYSP